MDFHPGVNVIIGSSNSGKTSILRALYWAVYNRPSGLSFVSHWNRDKKGNPIKPTRVTVQNDCELLSRIRSQELNGYEIGTEINDQILEAIGMDVPDDISRAFNLDAVNIQRQMDAPFLLSESSADVARFFNAIIRLDLIDRVLGKAESKRRENNKEKIRLEQEQKTIDGEIKLYYWIEEAEQLASKIQIRESRIEVYSQMQETLQQSVDDYTDKQKEVGKQKIIVSAVPLIEKIETISIALRQKCETLSRLQDSSDSWKEQKKNIKGAVDFSKVEKMITTIDEFRKQIYEKVQVQEKLLAEIDEYKNTNGDIGKYGLLIVRAEKELPKICPYCNQPLQRKVI